MRLNILSRTQLNIIWCNLINLLNNFPSLLIYTLILPQESIIQFLKEMTPLQLSKPELALKINK